VLDTGAPYLVMEHLEGEDLQSIVDRGPLAFDRATRYIAAACEVLGEAHALGIVHRDIKPSNLFVARGDRLVVLDFGLAKLIDLASSVTHDGVVLGSPRYMAPEQIRGARDVGPRADLWSLGATLYHLVTGRPPFPGTTIESVFSEILDGPIPALPDGPLAHVISRALARDPALRFATAREFALALRTRPAELDVRFEILELLGEGSHGTVYRARHRNGGREVALKVLRGDAQQIRSRFAREAAIVQRLDHPNTVRIYESGVTSDSTPFMVFELVRGRTLAVELQRGAMLPARLARVATQVCKALEEAHARGIVHRDITPSNILLVDYAGDADFVKLLDFGVAADSEAPNLTFTGQTLGTPRYMAPEQVLGERVDGRADLYALGLVMAEALTGTPVFGGSSAIATCAAQVSPDPVPLPPAVTGGPFAAVIARATAKHRDHRFSNAAEMLAAIERGPADRPFAAPNVERRSRTYVVPVLVAFIALLGITIVLLAVRPWASDSRSSPSSSGTGKGLDEARLRARLAAIGWPPAEVTRDIWGRCNYMRTRHEAGVFDGHRREWAFVVLMMCDSDATAKSEAKRFQASYPGSWTIIDGDRVLLAYTTAPESGIADEAASKQLADALLEGAPPPPLATDAAALTAVGLDENHLQTRLVTLGWPPAEVTRQDLAGCRHTRLRLEAGTFQGISHKWGDVLLLECASQELASSEGQRLSRGFPNASITVTASKRLLMVTLEHRGSAKPFGEALLAP
ncbi:MAG: serine/threonine protein kinase, partial [Deltaproteobacteria bacterium]|nr:serine/threonine protein kinase [Deltaproteobacteria bacterium]